MIGAQSVDSTRETPARQGLFCTKCGYSLRGLTSPQCPECGTNIDAQIAADPDLEQALLAWERRELGTSWRRCWVTIVRACANPNFYFTTAARRLRRPIASPSAFVALGLASGLLCYSVWRAVEQLIVFLDLWDDSHRAGQILDVMKRTLDVTLVFELASLVGYATVPLLTLLFIPVLPWIFARTQRRSFRYLDTMALMLPYAVLFQLLPIATHNHIVGPQLLAFRALALAVRLLVPICLFLLVFICFTRTFGSNRVRAIGASLTIIVFWVITDECVLRLYTQLLVSML